MSPQTIGLLVAAYVIGMPILLRLICHLQKKLVVDRAALKAGNSKAALKNLPKPLWHKVRERLSFAFKDKRPLKIGKSAAGPPNRVVLIGIYLLGLAVWVAGPLTERWVLLPVAVFIFFLSMLFGVKSSKDVVETRKKVLTKMFEIASSKQLVDNEYSDNPGAVIKVLEWNDYVKPQKAEFQVRTQFSDAGEEGFLQQFNQVFGSETAWVPSDDKETGAPGWNYDEGKVTIHAVPPLPTMAKWHENYVLDPGIAWSFFPIALGIENGIERPNPETGELEWILGFDLSGEAAKVGKKAGYKVSPTITTSPMVFVGGGTGGGKSLPIDTQVKVFPKNS